PLTARPARRHVQFAGAGLLDDHRHAHAVADLPAAALVAQDGGDRVIAVVRFVRPGEGWAERLRRQLDDPPRVLGGVRVGEQDQPAGEVLRPDVAVVVRPVVRPARGMRAERVLPRPGVVHLLAKDRPGPLRDLALALAGVQPVADADVVLAAARPRPG